ncbi:hypothetical protein [Streptomyces klenkii]|uniref:hypothetical protein n=1 Tax=Streptomyces klenkii TaxID=1420899 RepID=UPI003431F3C0
MSMRYEVDDADCNLGIVTSNNADDYRFELDEGNYALVIGDPWATAFAVEDTPEKLRAFGQRVSELTDREIPEPNPAPDATPNIKALTYPDKSPLAADPHGFLATLDDVSLKRVAHALHTAQAERLAQRVAEATLGALPRLGARAPFAGRGAIGRVIFTAEAGTEDGSAYWPSFATVHLRDGGVVEEVTFERYVGAFQMALTKLMPPSEGTQRVIPVPGVAMLKDPCTVCHDVACRSRNSGTRALCAACPEPWTVAHRSHPRRDCDGFTPVPPAASQGQLAA